MSPHIADVTHGTAGSPGQADPVGFLDDAARAVSDTVLYEGYLLYPYRDDALKNRHHWQFGVLMPPAFAASGAGEHSTARTEFLLDGGPGTTLRIGARWLWEGGGARGNAAAALSVRVGELTGAPVRRGLVLGGPGPGRGELLLGARALPGPYGGFRIRATIRNVSAWPCQPPADRGSEPGRDGRDGPLRPDPAADRDAALGRAFIAAQVVARAYGGCFLSLSDPPEWAADAARACVNERLWPTLLDHPHGSGRSGRPDMLLAAPIILPDHPEIAAESPATFCDATEIDEMLALRTSTLTDAEKLAARAGDPRAAELLASVAELAPAMAGKLHGRGRVAPPPDPPPPGARSPGPPPWLASGTPAATADTTAGTAPEVGSAVWLRPRPGRMLTGPLTGLASAGTAASGSDAQDMFVDGRAATVAAVLHDVDGRTHVAVTLDDDPGADLRREFGRFLYFTPDELERR
ncbi:hypothetical protein [Parafrankia discariae]|uniref:hypothetical protein n=1 Tax=Parafrankia discariae TaxID=365528 RepID=UPI0003704629|nr:hypothetical protein [Parafrankia discariae]